MNRLHEKKFWKTLFFSYLLILVFSLIIGFILFHSSLSYIEKSVTESSQTTLRKVSDSIERMETELNAVATNFISRDEYLSLLYAEKDLSSFKLERVADLQDELQRQTAHSNYVSAIYVWFENPQMAATTSGYFKTRDAFDSMLYKEYGLTLDELFDWIKGYKEIVIRPIGEPVNGQLFAVTSGTQDKQGIDSIILPYH